MTRAERAVIEAARTWKYTRDAQVCATNERTYTRAVAACAIASVKLAVAVRALEDERTKAKKKGARR